MKKYTLISLVFTLAVVLAFSSHTKPANADVIGCTASFVYSPVTGELCKAGIQALLDSNIPKVNSNTNFNTLPNASSNGQLLKKGSRGPAVAELQAALQNLQKEISTSGGLASMPITVDSVFGSKTELAVKSFQINNNLFADGVVGPMTSATLVKKIASSDTNDTNNTPAPVLPPHIATALTVTFPNQAGSVTGWLNNAPRTSYSVFWDGPSVQAKTGTVKINLVAYTSACTTQSCPSSNTRYVITNLAPNNGSFTIAPTQLVSPLLREVPDKVPAGQYVVEVVAGNESDVSDAPFPIVNNPAPDISTTMCRQFELKPGGRAWITDYGNLNIDRGSDVGDKVSVSSQLGGWQGNTNFRLRYQVGLGQAISVHYAALKFLSRSGDSALFEVRPGGTTEVSGGSITGESVPDFNLPCQAQSQTEGAPGTPQSFSTPSSGTVPSPTSSHVSAPTTSTPPPITPSLTPAPTTFSRSITSPEAGDVWAEDSIQTIHWTLAGGAGGGVGLRLSQNGKRVPGTPGIIAGGGTGTYGDVSGEFIRDNGSFDWVPDDSLTPGTGYTVELISSSGKVLGESSAFSISAPSNSFQLVAPSAGERVPFNSDYILRWRNPANFAGHVDVAVYQKSRGFNGLSYVAKDVPASWLYIVNGVVNFTWSVTADNNLSQSNGNGGHIDPGEAMVIISDPTNRSLGGHSGLLTIQ